MVRTKAEALGIRVHVGAAEAVDFAGQGVFGVLVQYPATDGALRDFSGFAERAHAAGSLLVMATDLLALTLLRSPGELGADVALGSAQRFGVPMGYGGPHAAFFATKEEHRRHLPGRLVGVSKDAEGRPAYRLSLQTREQHIRRDKATSNICTAQVLLAIMAAMYAVYHGPEGLRAIARRVHALALVLQRGLRRLGFDAGSLPFFDTLRVRTSPVQGKAIVGRARDRGMNLRLHADGSVGVSLDETTLPTDLAALLEAFAGGAVAFTPEHLAEEIEVAVPAPHARGDAFLLHPVFNRYHAEHEMLRYLTRLQARDLSLAHSMIPLGSCTMKLNGTSEMVPVTWPELAKLHPFAPADQARGYHEMFADLELWLAEITGFAAVSLQPNSGAQGEYAGLLTIRAYHLSRGDARRDVCLIPVSAHGTNPASAVTAGFRVVPVACDARGNIDVGDLRAKADAAPGRARRAHGHLSVDPRRLRGGDPRDLPRRARGRRPGLHGRREHERAGRADPARRHRGGRVPPQPAQDLLHPARRRRPGHGPDRGRLPPRALPARAPDRADRRRARLRLGGGRALGERGHPLHQLGLHPQRWGPRA